MAERKSTNPFYGLLVVVGIVFTVTACAYGVMTVRGLKPDEAAEASGAGAESSDLMTFLDRHGMPLLMGELGVLAVTTFLAMATDDYWARRGKAE